MGLSRAIGPGLIARPTLHNPKVRKSQSPIYLQARKGMELEFWAQALLEPIPAVATDQQTLSTMKFVADVYSCVSKHCQE